MSLEEEKGKQRWCVKFFAEAFGDPGFEMVRSREIGKLIVKLPAGHFDYEKAKEAILKHKRKEWEKLQEGGDPIFVKEDTLEIEEYSRVNFHKNPEGASIVPFKPSAMMS